MEGGKRKIVEVRRIQGDEVDNKTDMYMHRRQFRRRNCDYTVERGAGIA